MNLLTDLINIYGNTLCLKDKAHWFYCFITVASLLINTSQSQGKPSAYTDKIILKMHLHWIIWLRIRPGGVVPSKQGMDLCVL